MVATPGQIEAVVSYARLMPEGTVVPCPREVLLALASAEAPAPGSPTISAADLSVAQLGVRFDRKPSTIRGWCELRLFPGAYKLRGRDWRVPMDGVEAFEKKEQTQGKRQRSTGKALRLVRHSTVSAEG
jgi:hypothetical protein